MVIIVDVTEQAIRGKWFTRKGRAWRGLWLFRGSKVLHYKRKPHLRRACMKKRDARITHLHHRISHYIVIGDTRPSASQISIYWRRAKSERISDYKTHLRRVLMVLLTDLITSLGPYGTNTRGAQCRALTLLRNLRLALS
jgi:hypothetical protein